jgi:hypothetical protein
VTITGSYGRKVFEQRFAVNLQGREPVWRVLAQRGRFYSKVAEELTAVSVGIGN